MDFSPGDFCVTLNNEDSKYSYQFNVNRSRSEQICNYLDCLLMMMLMIKVFSRSRRYARIGMKLLQLLQ